MSNVAELGWRDDEADHVIRDPEGCHCSQSPDWSSQELLIIRNDKSYKREWETISILTWWSTAHKAGPPAVGGDVRGVVPALVRPGLRSFGWKIHFLQLNLTLVKFILKLGRSYMEVCYELKTNEMLPSGIPRVCQHRVQCHYKGELLLSTTNSIKISSPWNWRSFIRRWKASFLAAVKVKIPKKNRIL